MEYVDYHFDTLHITLSTLTMTGFSRKCPCEVGVSLHVSSRKRPLNHDSKVPEKMGTREGGWDVADGYCAGLHRGSFAWERR